MPNPFNLKRLFSSPTIEEPTTVEDSTHQNNARQEGETYKQYGVRLAGLSAASEQALAPTLQSVYYGIRREQQADANLQAALRKKQETAINNKEAQKIVTENDLEAIRSKIEKDKTAAEKVQKEIDDLKNDSYKRNRPAWIQLIISGVLLVPFTIYFFIFYSSVAYSAFFDNPSLESVAKDDIKLSKAIFDGQAISNAWSDGFFEVIFMLLMPVIFLAFGFILNRWEREKGKLNYLKIPALIIVAFIFDMLLAYFVSSKLYEFEVSQTMEDMPPYSWGMAFGEASFWIIIFLGFVAYLIWGITFGFFIKALDDLDMNKINQDNKEKELDKLNQQIEQQIEQENSLKNKIAELNLEIQNLRLNQSNVIRFDLTQIRLELANFFAGWMQYMAVLEKTDQDKENATAVFNNAIVAFQLNFNESTQDSK